MLRKSLFALTLLFVFGYTMAQDKKDAFYKAIDYCNCKVTYAYLNQFTSQMPSDKLEKKSFEKIKSNFGNCEIGKAIEYTKLSKLLNNNYFEYSNQKVSSLIDAIKSNYNENLTKDDAINKIIGSIFSSAALESTIAKYSDIGKLKDKLFNDLNSYFDKSFASSGKVSSQVGQQIAKVDSTPKTTIDLQSAVSELQRKVDNDMPGPFSPNWLSIIITVVLVAVVFFILGGRYAELKDRVKLSESNANSNLLNKTWNQNQPSNNNARELAVYKNSIEQQIWGVRKAVEDLQIEVTYLNRKSQGQGTISYNPKEQQIDKEQKSEIFFASIPNKDGSFNINAVTNSINPTASFYKFTITDSHSQKASFEFLNEERAIKDATNAPERILRPVCKINNALNQNAKRIRTVTPGIVIKQNDRWILDFPAEIEYE